MVVTVDAENPIQVDIVYASANVESFTNRANYN